MAMWVAVLMTLTLGAVGIPMVKLNNGVEMPVLAFAAEVWEPNVCKSATSMALEAGFRFIWSSTLVGDACQKAQKEAIEESKISRDELFIAGTVNDPKCSSMKDCYLQTKQGAEKQFALLGQKQLDMLMLDYPADENCDSIRGQWKAFEEIYTAKRVRSIAVSNFNLKQLQCLKNSTVPVVNQMRFAVGHGHDPVVQQDEGLGIHVQAYSPLAKGQLAKDPLCSKIGQVHGKSAVQVALKWILQRGVAVATQSTSLDHLKSDLDLFDFDLTDDEMKQLNDYSPSTALMV